VRACGNGSKTEKNRYCMKGMRYCYKEKSPICGLLYRPSASGQNALAAATMALRPPVGISDIFACEMVTVWAFGLRSDGIRAVRLGLEN
jgi:hypothetical protein